MIIFSNGHKFEYMVASGALAFDGKGWWWERPLLWLGLIRPELFTVVIKSLTRHPRRGNLRWRNPLTWLPFSPWSCVRFLPGGAVNKVGLTNPGIEYWCEKIAPKIDFTKYAIVGSIFGNERELAEMAEMMNEFDLVGLEVNVSCPNTGHAMDQAQAVIRSVSVVQFISKHPIIIKLSVDQNYVYIAEMLRGVAQAVSLNSVPWERFYMPGKKSPLWRLQKRVGGGGGGISGRPAQLDNWDAVRELSREGDLPVIGPSVMSYDDMYRVRIDGAKAISFGAIHLRAPWKPTKVVQKEMKYNEKIKSKRDNNPQMV